METLCDRVQQAIIEGAGLPPTLDAHRAACEECRFVAALSRDLGSSGSCVTPPAAADVAVGTPLAGRYRIEALIGRGGQGQVYRAVDLETHEVIALKLVRLRDDKETAAETANARRIRHPNICRVYHTERLGDHRLVVMEHLPGPTLAERLDGLSRAEAVRLFAGICRGVQAAHDAGVLHLDLKPQNVLLRDGTEPIVTDFGLSQLSEAATGGSGTPRYMAPEQRRPGTVDHRADIYALGRILDALIGGRSWRLGRLARRASADDPAARPADVKTLLQAVEAPVGWRRRVRRAAWVIGTLVAVLALLPHVLSPPDGRRAGWRPDLWDPDLIPAEAWNVALDRDGTGRSWVETHDPLWGCARQPRDLIDGKTQYSMWEHGICWRPPPTLHPEHYCTRLRASGRCGFPDPDDRLCERTNEVDGYRLLDARVRDLAQFPVEQHERLGFLVPAVPCGERSVTVHLDGPRKVIAVRVWYHEFPAPRSTRVLLWDASGRIHETDAFENGQARADANWPNVRGNAASLPVTTEIVPVVSDRVRVVIDTCSTLTESQLIEYRAGRGEVVPRIGWLYEIEVFARISRYEAWRRTLFGD